MNKFLCLLLLTVLSAGLLAQSANKKRLDFVNGEIKKIEQRIKEGQDPKLFEKFLNDFKKERK